MRKRKTAKPEISTASLPDIIFMLLFFFMVVTVLRKENPTLKFEIPESKSNTKIDQNTEFAYVYIGKHSINSESFSVQLNNRFLNKINMDESFQKLVSLPEIDISSFEIFMKADKNAPMKLIRQVKLAMRKAGIRHLYYLSENKA